MEWEEMRAQMVARQLERRGIRDRRVLEAMARVPRQEFVPEALRDRAYDDRPLDIGDGQTISQPYVVALTVSALGLSGGGRALDVGTGSGYAAAVLAEIVDEVYSVERIESLAGAAAERLARLGYDNVHVEQGDGSQGWPDRAPYAGIAVAAAAREVPEALKRQLEVGARLVVPAGSEDAQELLRITRRGESEFQSESLGAVRFVPLVGG